MISITNDIFDRTIRFIQRSVRWKKPPTRELILEELWRFKILVVMDDLSVASTVKFDLVNLLCRAFPNLTLLSTNEHGLLLPSIAQQSISRDGNMTAWAYQVQPLGHFQSSDRVGNWTYDLAIILGSRKLTNLISATESLFLDASYWDAAVSYEEPGTAESDWNGFGGRLSATMAGIETIKSFIRKIGRTFPEYLNNNTAFDIQSQIRANYSALNLAGYSCTALPLLPKSITIPDSLLVSGGAITSSAFYYLLSMFDVSGAMTAVDPKLIDEPDLNRYLLTTLADVGKPKVDIFKRHESSTLKISTVPVKFQQWYDRSQSCDFVLAGVDHIQSRWDIGRMSFGYLVNGATWLDTMTISVHDNDPMKACIGCLNVDAYQSNEIIPTYGPVSALAGLLMAVRWVLLATQFRDTEVLLKSLYSKSLQPALKGNTDWSLRMPSPDCPIKRHQ